MISQQDSTDLDRKEADSKPDESLVSKKNIQEGSTGELWVQSHGSIVDQNREPRRLRFASNEKQRYEIVSRVDPNAATLIVGVEVSGLGSLFLDDVMVELLPSDQELTANTIEYLEAFSRLYGCIRYFHPSDQCLQTDWDALALEGVSRVLNARSQDDLLEALHSIFENVAPSLQLWRGSRDNAPPIPELDSRFYPTSVLSISHTGVGTSIVDSAPGLNSKEFETQKRTFYTSKRIHRPIEGRDHGSHLLPEQRLYHKSLLKGLWARIPLSVYADESGTWPRPSAEVSCILPNRPPDNARVQDRLAGVVIAWNVFQHFYPYFDSVDVDWGLALRESFTRTASDSCKREFESTLTRMIVQLQDGHTSISSGSTYVRHRLPFLITWAGTELVVSNIFEESPGIEVGDVILTMDDEPISSLIERLRTSIPSPTLGYSRYLALTDIFFSEQDQEVRLETRKLDGSRWKGLVPRQPLDKKLTPMKRKCESGDEVAPGIVYCDLRNAETEDFESVLPQLEKAKGIIFDMRGYPLGAGTRALQHITDTPLDSATWCIPMFEKPGQIGMTFSKSHWTLTPREPRLTSNTAFLTNASAISYAETCMGIVEAYKLGEIIGETTAGTNGNVNSFELPGGIQICWTGMKVEKHDGSRHHGVGIIPRIAVKKTPIGIAEGRDEVLEAAIATLQEKAKSG